MSGANAATRIGGRSGQAGRAGREGLTMEVLMRAIRRSRRAMPRHILEGHVTMRNIFAVLYLAAYVTMLSYQERASDERNPGRDIARVSVTLH
jgi:hypothetical protein